MFLTVNKMASFKTAFNEVIAENKLEENDKIDKSDDEFYDSENEGVGRGE